MTEKESALWHRVSESEKKDILIDAKKIMDKFNDALDSVEKSEEARVERDECEREENHDVKSADEEFRKIMFKNSRNKNDNCIIAEKGAWT